ncbi:unnamed protein product, partial [Vitis vinifera]
MGVNLTEGAISMLCSGDAQGSDVKPVLQVADIRLVNTQQQSNSNERFRILLSDGCHLQQGMLATQRNELVKSGRLQKGSVVQLTQFVCNVIKDRMIIIIIDLDVILEKCDPIGEPKQYVQGGTAGVHSLVALLLNQIWLGLSLHISSHLQFTAKGELRHYNNPRGDGKVFSFDLLDSDGGEIRVTCFNAVADQFYNQIETGKVYLISKGSLKPAQKTFNHLRNDHEIFLESTSTIQPCFDDDNSIPRQQFHFRSISDVESMENNSVVDVIGVVSFISPSASIMRKNGTETQKRALHLKDMSGRSVELTLWGNFCNAEGQRLQNMLGTISTSQLFIEPDFPEARKLKEWFDKEGRNTPSVSISREVTSMGRTDVRKTISQIKDERLGTSEKPDWITVCATVSFIKVDNFCYTACPIMIGDRQCNKKVTNNGDGKWRCERCDQSVDDCDYRYILQFQIQDHTGLTWVTAFQECEQDDEKFGEILRGVLFTKYSFKLKVKEEIFSDEQRVKSTVVKAEKVNFSSESRFLLDMVEKHKVEDSTFPLKSENVISNGGMTNPGLGNVGIRQSTPSVNYSGNASNAGRDFGFPANQGVQHGNQYGSSGLSATGSTGMYQSCNSCGGTGHSSSNCPSVMHSPRQSSGGGYVSRASTGPSAGGTTGECYKCHQFGHWARDCPGLNTGPPAYGSSGVNSGTLITTVGNRRCCIKSEGRKLISLSLSCLWGWEVWKQKHTLAEEEPGPEAPLIARGSHIVPSAPQ